MKKFFKENYKFLIFMLILITVVNVELPYYIEAPGGTINLSKRIDENYDKKNGSLNMLYVTEYDGTVLSLIMGKMIKSWDISKIENQRLLDESLDDIKVRNKLEH